LPLRQKVRQKKPNGINVATNYSEAEASTVITVERQMYYNNNTAQHSLLRRDNRE